MKMYQQIILRAFLGLSVAGLLNGCTMLRDNMAKSTTDYNLVVEKAQNEMLLLNIVRASKRRPMYFTSFSSLKGQMNYQVQSGNLSIPFGRIGPGKSEMYSIAPSVSYSNTPLFELAVLDSKGFTCGIMTPVPAKTVEYYWRQGWPKEMLLHLFIYSIEANDMNGNKVVFRNYPDDQNDFNEFQKVIETVDLNTVEINVPGTPGKERDTNEASKRQIAVEFLILPLNKNEGNKDLQPVWTKSKDEKNSEGYKAYIRSPEAILYHLGEILRVENRKEDPYIPMINLRDRQSGRHPVRLFYARKVTTNDANDTAPCVSVDYEGVRYIIPQDPNSDDGYRADRSMHVLSLVSQLIGLQKEIEQTPVSGVVSVIGR